MALAFKEQIPESSQTRGFFMVVTTTTDSRAGRLSLAGRPSLAGRLSLKVEPECSSSELDTAPDLSELSELAVR